MQPTPSPPPHRNPHSDGNHGRSIHNSRHFEWQVTLRENLDGLLNGAFVGAGLTWYPFDEDRSLYISPDVFVALGRPKGHRMAYLQGREEGVAPQVVFDAWTPSRTFAQMAERVRWYERRGVQEFYCWWQERDELTAWLLSARGTLEAIPQVNGFVSPLLGISFHLVNEELEIRDPAGQPFKTVAQLREERDTLAARAKQEAARAEQEAARADALAAKLRALGLDPDAL